MKEDDYSDVGRKLNDVLVPYLHKFKKYKSWPIICKDHAQWILSKDNKNYVMLYFPQAVPTMPFKTPGFVLPNGEKTQNLEEALAMFKELLKPQH